MREIEGLRGIRGPHEKELADIAADKIPIFRELEKGMVSELASEIGGFIDDVDMGEEWCLSKEYFPGVTIHLAYHNYGDEFGAGEEEDISFYFSGDRVSWIPGEDLASLVEVQTIRMEHLVRGTQVEFIYEGFPSEMLLNAIAQRAEPFDLISPDKYPQLAEFLGARFFDQTSPMIRKSLFPKMLVRLGFPEEEGLEYAIEGAGIPDFPKYDAERLLILTINHALRWVKQQVGQEVPGICDMMFSGSYRQAHPDKFRS